MLYPLLISSMRIIVCLITTLFATGFFEIKAVKEIEPTLKSDCWYCNSWLDSPPSAFTIYNFGAQKEVKNCPVQDVADSCRTGAATNVIFGLALGYKSVIIPIFAIAEMAGMSHRIRERTDALDAAGSTTAVIGKGFAIGSAALVSLALFGAFVSRAGISTVDILAPEVFMGLIVGAMLPYWFSAMIMENVGSAALKMVKEVRRQLNTMPDLCRSWRSPLQDLLRLGRKRYLVEQFSGQIFLQLDSKFSLS